MVLGTLVSLRAKHAVHSSLDRGNIQRVDEASACHPIAPSVHSTLLSEILQSVNKIYTRLLPPI